MLSVPLSQMLMRHRKARPHSTWCGRLWRVLLHVDHAHLYHNYAISENTRTQHAALSTTPVWLRPLKKSVSVSSKTPLPSAHCAPLHARSSGHGGRGLAGNSSLVPASPIFHRFREIFIGGFGVWQRFSARRTEQY